MSLNDTDKINYIKNNFHQYFDLTLNKNIETTETVNLVILPSDIRETNLLTVLESFNETDIEKEQEVYCVEVIDGDTIWVKDVITDENGFKTYSEELYKVRFVGVDTPEKNQSGYRKAKEFVTEACLYKTFYINKDSEKPKDVYGRTLAVVIVENRNLNEILLKLGLAQVMYIPPSEFNPNSWTGVSPQTFQLHIDGINALSSYFNQDMTNIVFTPSNDLNTLYRCEVYKGIIYVKLNPFSQQIRMHLFPKYYDCTNNVLIFRDDMIEKETVTKSSDYRHYLHSGINSYYLDNGEIRNRNDIPIEEREYEESKWDSTFCDFSYNISEETKSFDNLEICAGYKYNNSNPFYSIHYTGVRDTTNVNVDDRCTLIDANYDELTGKKTNNITKYHYDGEFYIDKNDIKKDYGNINHINNIDKVYHKKLKYINDNLYSEENRQYAFAYWEEQEGNNE